MQSNDSSQHINEWIPNINMGKDYDQAYAEAAIHYDNLDNMASFFGRDMPVHRHAQYLQIHYIQKSPINFHINDQLYQVRGPALFMTPPSVPHSFQIDENAKGHVLTVHYSIVWQLIKRGQHIDLEQDLNRGICLSFEDLKPDQHQQWLNIEQTFNNLRDEWNNDHAAKSLVLENLSCLLIIQIARFNSRLAASTSVTNDDVRVFHQFTEQIEQHFREQWLLPNYHRAIGVSEGRLNQICQHISNNSPKKIIAERMLQEIKRLLIFSGKSVSEICYELGFKDPAYFSRFFKNQTGVSPLSYRKNQPTV